MIAASVCSGIGGAELAFAGLAHHAFMSEIDPFARAVLRRRFPHIPLHGDFTEITHDGPVDVFVGGTPCQSFSVAGLRRGMADARGNLALEFLRLADRLRARWVLWENVPGVLSSSGGRDFGAFVGGLAELGYGWAYRVLDAQFFGLAQRRKRVFVVGCLGDWRRAAAVLFEPSCLRGHTAPRREAREGAAGTLAARASAGGGLGTDFDCDGGLIARTLLGKENASHAEDMETYVAVDARNSTQGDIFHTLQSAGTGRGFSLNATPLIAYGGNRQSGPLDVATAVNAHGGPHGRLDFETETFIAHSLRADGFDAGEDGTGRGTPLVAFTLHGADKTVSTATETAVAGSIRTKPPGSIENSSTTAVLQSSAVRRLTPTECARLQGYPDDWLDITYRGKPAADGNKYRALGNAFAVPVVRWIARRMAAEHAADAQERAA